METRLFSGLKNNKAQCLLCSHFCILENNEKGKCGVRQNLNGEIVSLINNKVAAAGIDPIEKKPLFHVLPGSMSYSIAASGCNLSCLFCQNASLSQSPVLLNKIDGVCASPEFIIEDTIKSKCQSISYTYSEPTVFFELMEETALQAKENGLLNIMVSNGFMSSKALDEMKFFIDAANIDLKSFSNQFYEKLCRAKLKPVLQNLINIKKSDIFLEVTTLLITNENDSLEEIDSIAKFIKNDLGKDTPWHVSAFHPAFKMQDHKSTPLKSIEKALEAAHKYGLDFVYPGNIQTNNKESTYCPKCKNKLVERKGYYVIENRIEKGKCPDCKETINGIFK